MDRAYNDYRQFARWRRRRLLRRMKDNAVSSTPTCRSTATSTHAIILLTGPQAQSKCPLFGASSCGTRSTSGRSCCSPITSTSGPRPWAYKERWQIELFFKALKQNLRVKSFVGTTENALRIQIWTALLALLLLKWLDSGVVALQSWLRLNLFTYRHRDWLDDPFNTPPLARQSTHIGAVISLERPAQETGRP